MQPWDFMVVRGPAAKPKARDVFQAVYTEAAEMFDDDRQGAYGALKWEGILEAPVGICVTCDRSRGPGQLSSGGPTNPI
jgi:5,6-dimethylbenzimidazole synthase